MAANKMRKFSKLTDKMLYVWEYWLLFEKDFSTQAIRQNK